MEHGGNKHGPLADDQLARETRAHLQGRHSSRIEEWREPEPAADDQPGPARMPEEQAIGGTPVGTTPADVAGRSELARYLRPAAFPGDRDRLVAVAVEENAPGRIVERLRALPPGRRFANVTQAWEASGGGREDDQRRA